MSLIGLYHSNPGGIVQSVIVCYITYYVIRYEIIRDMARPGITYIDVDRAATQLSQAGQRPTVDRVREVLGTGSKSTIGPLLKTWHGRQAQTAAEADAGLPVELLNTVRGLFAGLQQAADARIEAMTTEHTQAQESLSKQLADRSSALQALESAHEQLHAAHNSLQEEARAQATAHQSLTLEHEALRTALSGAEQRLEDKNDEIERLTAQLQRVQANLEHYRDTAAQQREVERTAHAQQLTQSEAMRREAQQAFKRASAQLDQLNTTHLRVVAEHEQMKGRIKRLERAESRADALNQTLMEQKHRIGYLEKALAVAEASVSQLEKRCQEQDRLLAKKRSRRKGS